METDSVDLKEQLEEEGVTFSEVEQRWHTCLLETVEELKEAIQQTKVELAEYLHRGTLPLPSPQMHRMRHNLWEAGKPYAVADVMNLVGWGMLEDWDAHLRSWSLVSSLG